MKDGIKEMLFQELFKDKNLSQDYERVISKYKSMIALEET